MFLQSKTICNANEFPEYGMHKHLCPTCGTCWKHSGGELQAGCTKEQFAEAHRCPACGTETRNKHWSNADRAKIDAMGLRELQAFVRAQENPTKPNDFAKLL